VACYVADLARVAKPRHDRPSPGKRSVPPTGRRARHPTKEEAVRLVRPWPYEEQLGTAQRQVRPVTVPELRTMLEGLGSDSAGCRDRALLLLGFAGALRRSELVGLDVADIHRGGPTGSQSASGARRRTKRAPGGTIGIPYGSNLATCPVRAWRAWLEVSGIPEGAAFRPVDRHGHIGTTTTQRPLPWPLW